MNKAKEINLDSGDFISVSFNKGIERLKNICNIDIDRYFIYSRELYKLRNRLMHYILSDSLKTILNVIDGSIRETFDFVSEEIISHIDNESANKDILDDLKELLEINKNINSLLDNLEG